jgi:hypothetical protein
MLRVIFRVVRRRVVFNNRRFETLCHTSYSLAYEDGTDSVPERRTLHHTPGSNTKDYTQQNVLM